MKENYKLVICGGRGWNFKNILKLFKSKKLENNIIFTGYVPEEELPIFYSGASVCLPFFLLGFWLTNN